jgi:hypothetical protein
MVDSTTMDGKAAEAMPRKKSEFSTEKMIS